MQSSVSTTTELESKKYMNSVTNFLLIVGSQVRRIMIWLGLFWFRIRRLSNPPVSGMGECPASTRVNKYLQLLLNMMNYKSSSVHSLLHLSLSDLLLSLHRLPLQHLHDSELFSPHHSHNMQLRLIQSNFQPDSLKRLLRATSRMDNLAQWPWNT
jgi:hypothetical protein